MQVISRSSLISKASDTLRLAIFSGEFQEHLPNVRTLGRSLGVSVPTVLAALKVLEHEKLITVQRGHPTRITSSAKAGGQASPDARQVVFLNFSEENIEASPYYQESAEQLRDLGYKVEMRQRVGKRARLTEEEFGKILARYRPGCWVLVGAPIGVQELFVARKLPCLVEGGTAGPGLALPDFEIDYASVYRHAAHQFLNNGHRHIRLIIPAESARKNPRSIDAFTSTVRERFPQIPVRRLLVLHDGSVSHLKSLLAGLYADSEKPTGLLVSLVSRLILVQSWLLARGYRIPSDVSLICRDSDELIGYLDPTPAHYAHSGKQAIRKLVRAIIGIVDHLPVGDHITIMPEFVKGGTLGACRASGA